MFAAGTLAAAAVGTAAVVLHSWQAGSHTPVDRTPADESVSGPVGSTLARIAAESRNPETSPPAVRAAPVAQHSLPDSGTGGEQVSARLPEGYSFVGFHGEMAKAGLGVRTDAVQAQDGPDWLGGPEAAETLAAQARAHRREWTFGWIRLAPGAREGDLAPQLASAGAAIVGSSGRLLRARLPGDEAGLTAIARLPAVDALGAMPVEARLRAFDRHQPPNHEPLPVFVTLMEADPNGRWRRELAALGAVVGRYDPDLRVYEASVVRSVLDVLGATDFVLAVEPVGTVEAAHDTAVPAMGADALRAWEGSAGIFSGVGGASVPIAVMDTGLNVRHPDISSNRSSICGANFVYFDPLVDDDDLWVDAGGHGTHVTGTIVGNGAVLPRYAGMAPRVQHVRFAKVLSHAGRGDNVFILRGMDFLGRSSACPDAGWSSDAVKPLVVNMSLSSVSLDWEGRTVDERKLDSVVWDRRQLYVVAASNSGNRGFSDYAAAKNSLAVGAALDSGSLAGFSSHGPTADGRLAPQIVGTGVDVHSAAGDGSREGYHISSGTSMASPAVAGLAALLMDAVPAHRERPALTRARLMASAIRPDVWLEDPAAFPAENSHGPGRLQTRYGLGKASARTSVLDRDRPDGWRSGGAVSELEDGEYAWVDIDVPDGASRLDVVLTWDEPPADSISGAVLNDLDLWLDHGADCAAEPCGERASTSRVDNVEWIFVRNPAPGTHRAKVAAWRVYTEAPRAALAWTVVRGSATPNLELSLDKDLLEVESGGQGQLELELTADAYVAAGTRLRLDCRPAGGARCTEAPHISAEREDGVATARILPFGAAMELGELGAGETFEATITFPEVTGEAADAFRVYFNADAWNANAASASVLVRTGDAGDTDVPEAAAPANGAFADAMRIDGVEGSVPVDPVRATTEPGEPVFAVGAYGRPAGSVWHSWTAHSNGRVSFRATPEAATVQDDRVGVSVFRGDRIAGLDPAGSGEWGVGLFAEAGQTYLIRAANVGRAVPFALNWSAGPRPANDDFAAAALLEEAAGSVEGTNAGATLESGEFFGELAATVWYRWTAPADGSWKFESSNGDSRVLAFTGESVSELRLVSGFPGAQAVFPVRGGDVYRVAVAAADAYASGQAYELTWANHDRATTNDDFAAAEEIAPGDSSQPVDIDRDATVEPGEPVGSGIRTKWWAWTASADGTWVWRIDELTRPFNRLMMSVFAGDSLDDLELVATNGERMAIDLDFRAEGARRYWVSAGFPAADLGAYEFPSASATLVWGTAPKNDDAAEAVAISGARGSVAGSNAFATSAHGERRVDVGRQTVWYAFEAPASGWFRFAAAGDGGPWALTVYRDAADGAGLETVASGDEGGTAVRFETAAGVRHLIALGVRGGGRGGEFTLQWELLDPSPVRYVGRLADGDRDSRDNWVAISSPRGLAMHPDGNALYLLTGSGLQIFERDRRTGRLDHAHLLETDNSGCAIAAWDARRQRLLVDDWGLHAFASVGAGPELLELGRVHPGDCANAMLIDSTGSDLYRISRSGYTLEHFVLDPDGAIRRVADHDLLAEFTPHKETAAAVLSNDGHHLYAAAADILQVFERDPESGELARVDTQVRIDDLGHRLFLPLAIADDDGHLFVGEGRSAVAVFSLEDPLNPRRLGASERSGGRYCSLADVRAESPTADVFCNTFGFSVRWDSQDGELESTDWFLPSASEALLFHEVRGLAVSPDKRHLYVSAFPPTWEGGSIAIFARPRYCRDGDEVESGTGCGIHDTPLHFAVDADSTGCLRGSGTELCEDAAHEQRDAEIAGVALTFVAVKNEDGSWTIKDVEPDSGAPDLVVDAPAVDSNPEPGASFSLSVVVRNGGMAEAPAAELRYYRSDNARISAADAEVGAGAVEALAAGGDIDTSIELTAPSTPGTHFYGACVDRVPGEFATGNNCSYGVSVDVDTPDDHGDWPADATPVAVPSATAGDLETVGDRDYFRVEIAETTTLTIETTGDTDTFGTLFDGDGATSLGTDDDGGAQRNFRIERNLTAGTYYVQVRGFSAKTTGPYTLNVDGD